MPQEAHIAVKDGDVLLMVGTMKGAFLLRSNAARGRWELGGPTSIGTPVYAMALDQRVGRRRIWMASQSWQWGTFLRTSDDFGKSWTEPETYTLKFPEETEAKLKNIWQIRPGRADEPDTLYCGVEPTALFRSTDNGGSWSLVRGLWDHPHRQYWAPGGGGQCLHTIVLDPKDKKRMLTAMSTGGVYRSENGGESWTARNQGVRVQFMPDKYPEFGQCVHKVVQHPSKPQRLFLQNHWGLYRSDDWGDTWRDIANGVPSDFGFCMAMHPHDADTVYIIPIESDQYRCTPEGKLRVYRTLNAGESWEALTRGLPQTRALETILRDGMATDSSDPAGIYFGTRSGKVYGSKNNGDSWQLIWEGLPPVVCVKAAVIGDSNGGGKASGQSSTRNSARASSQRSPSGSARRGRKTGKKK